MPSSILEPGFRLNKYKVLSHIATGGMGVVYKAMDLELRRTVALKVLTANLAENSRVLHRFQREARHVARLSNPHIVTLFECGYDDQQDLYFLVLEYIDGIDLEAYIKKRQRLEPEEARLILIQAAKALEHAHRHGVIHRDIKPSNFLLAKEGQKTVVKLTDLGLALTVGDDEFKLTREGCTVGTIDYMSPEQARNSRAADIRSDIYSLGCTAFHMLAGKPPFAEGGLGERVIKHLEDAPPDVRQFNPAVSAPFCAVLAKMLAKKPEQRYATPGLLLKDLKHLTAEASSGENEKAAQETKTTVLTRKRKTAVLPGAPVTAEQARAAALHERAVQVLAEGGGDVYARELLINCLQIEPFCLAYRQTLRDMNQKASPSTLGRWLGTLSALALKSKMHRAKASSDWLKVLEHGEDVLVHHPADVDAHRSLAHAAAELDQPHLATWLLEQGLKAAPDHVELMQDLAELQEKRGDLKSAMALWEKICELAPDNPVARRKLNDISAQHHMASGNHRR